MKTEKIGDFTFTTKFVPMSVAKHLPVAPEGLKLSWNLEVKNSSGVAVDFQFWQGVGHIPWYRDMGIAKKYKYFETYLAIVCETGRCLRPQRVLEYTSEFQKADVVHEYATGRRNWKHVPHEVIPTPNTGDILECLIDDSRSVVYSTLEEWAPELGYNTDSIKARQIYDACRDALARLIRVFGMKVVDQLLSLDLDEVANEWQAVLLGVKGA